MADSMAELFERETMHFDGLFINKRKVQYNKI